MWRVAIGRTLLGKRNCDDETSGLGNYLMPFDYHHVSRV